jgi:hypothetical protein
VEPSSRTTVNRYTIWKSAGHQNDNAADDKTVMRRLTRTLISLPHNGARTARPRPFGKLTLSIVEGRRSGAGRRGPAPRLRSGRPEQESKGASDGRGVGQSPTLVRRHGGVPHESPDDARRKDPLWLK